MLWVEDGVVGGGPCCGWKTVLWVEDRVVHRGPCRGWTMLWMEDSVVGGWMTVLWVIEDCITSGGEGLVMDTELHFMWCAETKRECPSLAIFDR